MATWNGIIGSATRDGSTVSQTLLATATLVVPIGAQVPNKWFKHGLFSCVLANGVSGGIGIQIVGYIGGASFVIAGTTALTTVGSKILGTTGGATFGFPRPAYAIIQPVAGVAGFTATLGMGAWY
jgi:hypothetical protein